MEVEEVCAKPGLSETDSRWLGQSKAFLPGLRTLILLLQLGHKAWVHVEEATEKGTPILDSEGWA